MSGPCPEPDQTLAHLFAVGDVWSQSVSSPRIWHGIVRQAGEAEINAIRRATGFHVAANE